MHILVGNSSIIATATSGRNESPAALEVSPRSDHSSDHNESSSRDVIGV